jgi:esterase/lipase
LIGTSRGTISAAHAAIHLKDKAISGLVLTASVVSFKKTGAIPTQAIDRITVPTLVVHHSKDACIHCKPHEARNVISGLKQAPLKELVMVDGGHSPTGDVCQGQHWHGFVNYEQATINRIAIWILSL